MAVFKVIVTETFLFDGEILGEGPFTHGELEARVEDGEALSGVAVSKPVEVAQDDIEAECEGIGEDPAFFDDAYEG